MKLSNIVSKQLLPRFAGNISWVMDALDQLIKETAQRVKSIDAPLTMESIEACTDAELEALYDQYGVAKYYPDLSRETRNKMLYEMCRIYRYLGTPKAIEVLCNYIFDGVQLNVKVEDNLAFDENGDLVDESLLDVFDVDVNPTQPIFGADVNARIIANIIRFSRNSQALRSIVYTFIQDFALSVSPCKRTGNPQSTQTWPQDSLCVPYTPPTPAYTEITLYLSGSRHAAQRNVISTFTGDVNTYGSFSYPLYTDSECTIPWTGYDYSNDYEIGTYVDGFWTKLNALSDLPSTTTAESADVVFGYALLDLCRLWIFCNYSQQYNIFVNISSVVVRIYPKNQQHYAFYLGTANVYGNTSVSNGSIAGLKGKPGISSAQTVPWNVQDATLPTRTIQQLLGSAGNELSQSGVGWRDPSLDFNFYQIANASGASISLRAVVFTLSKPTLYGWLNSDKTDKSHGTNMISFIYDESGNAVQYDPAFTYRVIGIFKSNGDAATNSWASVSGEILEQGSGTNNLQIRRSYSGTITISKVWYIKEVISPIETTFGASVTIPAGYEVESVTCSRGYAFAANVVLSGTIVDYEIPGEKIYFDSTNTALVGVGVKPALQIAAIKDLSQGISAVLSSNSGYSGTKPASASASYVNSGGYTVKGSADFSNSSVGPSVASNMQTFPVYFNLSDSSGSWLYFCFRVPQTLWQFQNGVFTWLGDTTSMFSLAYWYNTRAVQINLRPIT